MAAPQTIDDVQHWWGEDIAFTPGGDLARASGVDRSTQRVARRLLTNPAEYLSHPEYGGGVRREVGQNTDVARIQGTVRGQMLKEEAVQQEPPPTVTTTQVPTGVAVSVKYTAAPEKTPAALSFTVTPEV